jgi:hypothetical protein
MTTISKEMILQLADNMAMGAANLSGQGYDTLINSREQLKEVINGLMLKSEKIMD